MNEKNYFIEFIILLRMKVHYLHYVGDFDCVECIINLVEYRPHNLDIHV